MAVTAAIVLNKSSARVNEPVQAKVTISNGGIADVTMRYLQPLVKETGASDPTPYNSAIALGMPSIGPGDDITVPAAGSLEVFFDLVPFAPVTSIDVLCEVGTSDGSIVRPTADTLEVVAIPAD